MPLCFLCEWVSVWVSLFHNHKKKKFVVYNITLQHFTPRFIQIKLIHSWGVMTGITQRGCGAVSPLWPL